MGGFHASCRSCAARHVAPADAHGRSCSERWELGSLPCLQHGSSTSTASCAVLSHGRGHAERIMLTDQWTGDLVAPLLVTVGERAENMCLRKKRKRRDQW
ncbi:hypothetical protein PVAP13_3KG462400 [Panicum virgatum]|uniref:Uncharacterized protein n=1 Tax=Panicum virgatum TaxID=38727 RepID=A0A8T0UZ20_PANVG|nr:hypothetical protein PVAP13_3KG462400 [Panicum virgatum]